MGKSGRAFHLLVVEDDVNDVMFLKRAFDTLGIACQVSFAIDGEEAIEVLSSTPAFGPGNRDCGPTHVLLDLTLPKQSGIEVLAWLRQHRELSGLPVVVFSSSRHASELSAATKLGVDLLRVKPVSFGDYVQVVGEIATTWGLLNVGR